MLPLEPCHEHDDGQPIGERAARRVVLADALVDVRDPRLGIAPDAVEVAAQRVEVAMVGERDLEQALEFEHGPRPGWSSHPRNARRPFAVIE